MRDSIYIEFSVFLPLIWVGLKKGKINTINKLLSLAANYIQDLRIKTKKKETSNFPIIDDKEFSLKLYNNLLDIKWLTKYMSFSFQLDTEYDFSTSIECNINEENIDKDKIQKIVNKSKTLDFDIDKNYLNNTNFYSITNVSEYEDINWTEMKTKQSIEFLIEDLFKNIKKINKNK